ncbi:MAG TPA: BTAD domain-containing putative transcriptional regulator [Gemmatimonadaceae bacterium]
MRPNNFRLITLGRLALVSPDGVDESVGLRRRKLTLLAVLALSDRPYSRDALAEMFWGDEDDERARHSLSDALSHFRRLLGRDAIAHRSSDITLSEGVRLDVDALELAAACASRDSARAVELYGGPLLDGIHVTGSARFEEWVSRERERCARLFTRSCEAECLSLARSRRWDDCAALARRWLAAAPLSTDAALYLINALKAPGSRESALAALAEYRALAGRLERDFDAHPDQRVAALAAELSARVADSDEGASPGAQRSVSHSSAPQSSAPQSSARATRASRAESRSSETADTHAEPRSSEQGAFDISRSAARKRTLIALGAAALSLALITGGTYLAGRRAATPVAAASPSQPVVAITLIQNVRNDSSVAWLEEGLKQMIAADLSRSGSVDIVAPSRVRDAARRVRASHGAPLGSDDALRLARQLGATWSVTGGLTRGEGLYVLDVGVRDVGTGKLVRLFTITGPDILEVADQAASHILAAANAGRPGPRLADMETSNVGAYQHYVRAVQAAGEGRFADQLRELDAAIAMDSGFVSALSDRFRIAQTAQDRKLVERLANALNAARNRAGDWDRLREDVFAAQHNGEHSRAVTLGRQLVERYPHDPRAYEILADVYALHGRWEAADSVFHRALSLDSLGMESGRGPCAPCTALGGVVRMRLAMGELDGAEKAARRWVSLQPDAPAAWSHLAEVLSHTGRYDSALTVARRAASLAGDDAGYDARIGRILVMARRYAAADSAARAWLARDEDDYHIEAMDLRSTLLRERGRFRESNRLIERLVAEYPAARSLELVRADGLARLGEWKDASLVYEGLLHDANVKEPSSPYQSLAGDAARAFAWDHVLLAEAIAPSGDTIRLRALADSVQSIGARSYYGRDWRLHHHVRGLIAERGGRLREAIREFDAARWGSAGWTVTVAHMARAHIALGEPKEALALLREAYKSSPDAMGRYLTRSELDLLMAEAFGRAGMRDSSEHYAAYVRNAWSDADPEVKSSLAVLGGS